MSHGCRRSPRGATNGFRYWRQPCILSQWEVWASFNASWAFCGRASSLARNMALISKICRVTVWRQTDVHVLSTEPMLLYKSYCIILLFVSQVVSNRVPWRNPGFAWIIRSVGNVIQVLWTDWLHHGTLRVASLRARPKQRSRTCLVGKSFALLEPFTFPALLRLLLLSASRFQESLEEFQRIFLMLWEAVRGTES